MPARAKQGQPDCVLASGHGLSRAERRGGIKGLQPLLLLPRQTGKAIGGGSAIARG